MRLVAGPCEAMVMPQSNGLSWTLFPVMRLFWLGPVSSLIRMPPELWSTSLSRTRGVIGAHEVDAFAAVVALVGFKGGNAGAGAGGDVEGLVVAVDVVAGEGDVAGVGDQDAFKVGIADVEAGDDDVGDAGRGARRTCRR